MMKKSTYWLPAIVTLLFIISSSRETHAQNVIRANMKFQRTGFLDTSSRRVISTHTSKILISQSGICRFSLDRLHRWRNSS